MKDEDFRREFETAVALREAGDAVAAMKILESIEAASRQHLNYWLVVGYTKKQLDDFEGAERAFREAVSLRPESELASRGLFHCLWNNGRSGDADAEERALQELGRFLSIADSEYYREIVQELYEKKDLLWPPSGWGDR